ncbi:MAG: hypothetical protein QXJ28_03385 [Candidatus Pacearchaeota archaeon]
MESEKKINPLAPIDANDPFGFTVNEKFLEKIEELEAKGEIEDPLLSQETTSTSKKIKNWEEEGEDDEEEIILKPKKDSKKASQDSLNYEEVYKEVLKNFGITPSEDFEYTEENVLSTISDNYLDKIKEEFFNGVPPEGIEIIEHLKNGGNLQDYLQIVAAEDLTSLEIEDNVSNQRKVMREYFKATTNFNDAKIKEKIERLEERGLLAEEAQAAMEDWEEIQKNRKEQLLKQQAEENAKNEKRLQEFRKAISNKITTAKEIKGLPLSLSPKERKELEDYILKPTVKLPDGRTVSKNIADMLEEQDEETFILQALLRKDGYKLVSGIKKKITTEDKKSLVERIKVANKTNSRLKSTELLENLDIEDEEFIKKNENKLWKQP